MTTTTREQLVAEQGFLQERLKTLPNTARLTRSSLESRLEQVAGELGQLPVPAHEPARARITFNGGPVVGTHGVVAAFGAKAVHAFADAVATVAASLTSTLKAMGPIPGRGQNQLLITNVALGSFGFELEERGDGGLPLNETTLMGAAIERTQELLRSSIADNDEALAEAAEGLDRRAIDKVRQFVEVLADDDAVCTLVHGGRSFRFADSGDVHRSMRQLSADNLSEREQTFEGRFEGVLPTRRSFEFRTVDGELLVGKIDPALAEPEAINQHLNAPAEARMLVTKAGEGRPRYLLVEFPEWDSNAPDDDGMGHARGG